MNRDAAPEAWDEYWRLTQEAAAHRGGGPQDEVLARFWRAFFLDALRNRPAARVVDLACGNGVVTRLALEAAGEAGVCDRCVVGVDLSQAALADLRRRSPGVLLAAADALRVPFASATFDVVTSQFGLEYAGAAAFAEAARLVARGGTFAAVIHRKDGALYRECAVNLEAATAVAESGVLPAFRSMTMASHALRTGKGSRVAFRRAEGELQSAVGQVEAALRRLGEGVAGGAIRAILADIGHMSRRVANFDPREAAGWAEAMSREMRAYAERMAAMLGAAVDVPGMEAIESRVRCEGLVVYPREEMWMGVRRAEPAAWVLRGERRRRD